MRIARALLPDGRIGYGRLEHDAFLQLPGLPGVGEPAAPMAAFALDEVRLLAPCTPGKIVCIGRNYVEHAAEHGADVPKEPLMFLKPPSSLIGPGDAIVLPRLSTQVEHEAELAVVIGRQARHLTQDNALSCVLGYTVANDVTARDLQRRDGQWSRAKGFDTFCPLGPWIETRLESHSQRITCEVNGVLRQSGMTGDMVFAVPLLLEYITAVMTLEPGDVLLTGTPAGVGRLEAGDTVAIEISGIGKLKNLAIQEGFA
jgi:2-keto-4-pentenoate hydratase/2-oxohepta-3-ene-1,7-dioic acid hydratase in catechol pathway